VTIKIQCNHWFLQRTISSHMRFESLFSVHSTDTDWTRTFYCYLSRAMSLFVRLALVYTYTKC